jgi:hypothetical protein
MPAATRLLAAFLLLTTAFLVLIGFAAFELVAAGQHTLAAVVGLAGLGGAAAGGFTYWLLRRDVEALSYAECEAIPEAVEPEVKAATPQAARTQGATAQRPPAHRPALARRPIRVQHMPVAELPAAYVDAVMRGAQARLSALKSQGRPH